MSLASVYCSSVRIRVEYLPHVGTLIASDSNRFIRVFNPDPDYMGEISDLNGDNIVDVCV